MLRPCPASFDAGRARLRIALTYGYRHRRLPDLSQPRRFTELVQWRKLHDRSPGQALLLDKIASKALVAGRLGRDWVVPLVWSAEELPEACPTGVPVILKARHGCNQNRVLRHRPTADQWRSFRRLAANWVSRPYGLWLDEWAYRDVPRGVLLEPLIEPDGQPPVDYKVFVFGRQATHVQVHTGRGSGRHRWTLHDRGWRQLTPGCQTAPAPRSLQAMLAAAEELAGDSDFVRVDFYEFAEKPVFGEFCLYPGSGLDPFPADWMDWELGELWLAAIAARRAPGQVAQPVQACAGIGTI